MPWTAWNKLWEANTTELQNNSDALNRFAANGNIPDGVFPLLWFQR
jgi:hypothetical protein